MVVFRITLCKFNVGQCYGAPDEVYSALKNLFGEAEALKAAVWCDDSAVGSCYYSSEFDYRIAILEPPIKPPESLVKPVTFVLIQNVKRSLRPCKAIKSTHMVLMNRKRKKVIKNQPKNKKFFK